MPITVLGAGVAGLCVATELSARGHAVRVHDPNGIPGPHACSWWAGGMLAPFCEGETAPEPVVRLGQESAAWWRQHGAQVISDGSMVVALGRDRGELDRFARRTTSHQWLDVDQIAALEPDLAGRFSRALYFADEGHLTPRAALAALTDHLGTRGVPITRDRPAQTTGPTIDCRGLTARDALPDLRGVKGEMLVLRCPEITLRRPIRLLHPRIPIYLVPRGDGHYMLGATQIETAERARASVRSVLELLSAAYALHPAFGEAEIVEIGVDARPAFPDNLPRIRRRGDTIYVNGLFRHGFLLAPALARMTVDHIEYGIIPEVMHDAHS
ncbi:glycine oxidase ThiO [Pelagibacterium luteolum]|uniref:glycine oxidase ThiO n=1 Tax=Pelagibacterium luteolum TaxID=440168 RepID=UPI001AEC9B5E|nr:glycine oxidase ThiO [Pelagibacterium luteolum]